MQARFSLRREQTQVAAAAMLNGPAASVGAFLLLVGVSATTMAEPLRTGRLSQSALQAAVRAAAAPPWWARRPGPIASAPRPGVVARASVAGGGGGSPGPAPWMPASLLPRLGVGGPRPMDRASSALDRLRRRIFTRLLGARGARLGFYVGRNLAKGDVSGVRSGGLKLEFQEQTLAAPCAAVRLCGS